jgi:hypothetical protein
LKASYRHRAGIVRPAPHRVVATTLIILIAVPAVVVEIAAVSSVMAQSYAVDSAASEALTSSLRNQHLPLVGAQVLKSAAGGKRLVLYGFVATDFGKRDAERKALQYLSSNRIPVENRIAVRPEIAKLKSRSAASTPPHSSATKSFDQIISDIERYGIKSAPDEPGTGAP